MTEQWRELKETITELRDNDGTGTQQEVCKFLVNYMDVLEKQMQKPKTIQEIQAESEKYQKAFEDGYEKGYAQARFDYEQEQKIGHWIRCDILQEFKCSECRVCFRNKSNYCPNCGTKMESEGQMSKCRYDLSEDCNNKDCLNCVLDKIRAEIMSKDGLEEALEIIDKYRGES